MKDVGKKTYNILYTTPFGIMEGGGQWSLYYLIKHLNKDRFHPIVVCPAEGELAGRMRGAGAEVIFFNVGRIRYLNPLVIKKFISIINEKQIALIHTDSTTETFYAGIAARIKRIPLLWHIRVSDREWFLDRILSLLSTRLILVADSICQRFSWLKNSQKMVVVHNGIDVEEFDHSPAAPSIRKSYNITKDMVLLGCIGRIEQRKGQEYLISAMRHIESAKLILVGGGKEKDIDKIKMLCKKFDIADRVKHIGYRDKISSLLKEIDMLILPSITEGFSRIILEAMAATKPVIATDVGGNQEAIADGKTGYIVPARNSTSLAAKIKELVNDKKKRIKMGQAGRRRVEKNFTIKRNVDLTEMIYIEVLRKE